MKPAESGSNLPDDVIDLIPYLREKDLDKSQDFLRSLVDGYGFEELGEIDNIDNLPELMSLEAKKMFFDKKRPINKLKLGEVIVYLGKADSDGSEVSASVENGQKYLGYDHNWERDRFFKTITSLVGVIKMPGSV